MNKQQIKPRYTFEQEMQLRKFYDLKHEKRQKEIRKFFNGIVPVVKIIVNLIYVFFSVGLKMVVSAFLAIVSINIIYRFNEPLGYGYAQFASYVVAIGIYLLMPQFGTVFKDFTHQ